MSDSRQKNIEQLEKKIETLRGLVPAGAPPENELLVNMDTVQAYFDKLKKIDNSKADDELKQFKKSIDKLIEMQSLLNQIRKKIKSSEDPVDVQALIDPKGTLQQDLNKLKQLQAEFEKLLVDLPPVVKVALLGIEYSILGAIIGVVAAVCVGVEMIGAGISFELTFIIAMSCVLVGVIHGAYTGVKTAIQDENGSQNQERHTLFATKSKDAIQKLEAKVGSLDQMQASPVASHSEKKPHR